MPFYRRDLGAQANQQLFARHLRVPACFGGNGFHQGIELFIGGLTGDVVQIECLQIDRFLQKPPPSLAGNGAF